MNAPHSAARMVPATTIPRIRQVLSPGRVRRVALVGPLPPRRCGLATFTADVRASLIARAGWQCDVVAVVEPLGPIDARPAAIEIRQEVEGDYERAAARLNYLSVDVVSLQHEFGIFGGPDGAHILAFLTAVRAPVVTTLHTVLEQPSANQRRILGEILRHSAHVIVMAAKGLEILVRVYGARPDRVSVCAHGAPDRPLMPAAVFKADLGLDGHRVLLTFGLLSQGKGLETMIAAMPAIVRRHPDVLYVILGATHPHVIRQSGESYREGLIELATQLGVLDSVRFVDAFVEMPQLMAHLGAADIFVTPYPNEAQVTSGTLAYAVALGKPVVSTPYWHAAELVDERSGALVGFGDADGFAAAICRFLDDPERLQTAGAVAWNRGRVTIWARSAEHYIEAFETVIARAGGGVAALTGQDAAAWPDPQAVSRTTDSCGILQHSSYGIAHRAHGYCTDDNARGLILVQRWRRLGLADPQIDRLEETFSGFILQAWNPERGWFRNFMGYDRGWQEDSGSEDSNGRAWWALGEVVRHGSGAHLRIWAQELAAQVLTCIAGLTSLRARCFAVLGAEGLLDAAPHLPGVQEMLVATGADLMERIAAHGRPAWPWFEPSLSYDNARIPQALLVAGRLLRRPDMIAAGLESLGWLESVQRAPAGHFRPVGSAAPATRRVAPVRFDQQPIEACATVDAALAAFEITADPRWLRMARTAHAWFLGGNDAGLSLADGRGGCFDGLRPDGLNRNQGAESILALQMANAAMALVPPADTSLAGRFRARLS